MISITGSSIGYKIIDGAPIATIIVLFILSLILFILWQKEKMKNKKV